MKKKLTRLSSGSTRIIITGLKHQGSALITALFIMTLTAIIATAISTKLQTDIQRTQAILQRDDLYVASKSVLVYAISTLNNPDNKFHTASDTGVVLEFPQQYKRITPGVVLSGRLYDLQARLNLNSLTDKKYSIILINLLGKVAPELNEEQRVDLTLALLDWISPYDLNKGKDFFTNYYLKQNPSYLPSHMLMASISELRLLYHVTAHLYQQLNPYLSTLPIVTPININTAPHALLASLNENGLSDTELDELLAERGDKGINSIDKIRLLLTKLHIPDSLITLDSAYYLSVATVKSDFLTLKVYTLLQRQNTPGKKMKTIILSQRIEGF